jgi:hypothetical protein
MQSGHDGGIFSTNLTDPLQNDRSIRRKMTDESGSK